MQQSFARRVFFFSEIEEVRFGNY